MVSLLRNFPSTPFIVNSPPPWFFSIPRAASTASLWVLCTLEALSASFLLFSHEPSGRLEIVLSLSLLISTLHKKFKNWHFQNHEYTFFTGSKKSGFKRSFGIGKNGYIDTVAACLGIIVRKNHSIKDTHLRSHAQCTRPPQSKGAPAFDDLYKFSKFGMGWQTIFCVVGD
jgi:hypothetical protein